MAMLFRHRHRRSLYPQPQPSGVPLALQRLIVLLVLGLLLWWGGRFLLGLFGLRGSLDRLPTALTTEDRGIINVSLQGADLQTAEDGMMLFPGDGLKTGPNAHASLHFFDDAFVRLDSLTDLTIEESGRGDETIIVRLAFASGGAWVSVPHAKTSTGSTVHELVFPSMTVSLPPGTEAIVSSGTIVAFAAEGQGITVTLKDKDPFIVGEGQQWVLPPNVTEVSDPYAYRSPIENTFLTSPLLLESRRLLGSRAGSASSTSRNTEILSVTAPAADATVPPGILTVKGTVTDVVDAVRVNGHAAIVNAEGAFSVELSLPEGEKEFEIGIEAVDTTGKAITTVKRIVKIGGAAPVDASSPTIDAPAKAGETYRSNSEEIVLRGKAPANAEGIQVNEYRLQLFNPEKGEWSYIASLGLGNMKTGTNTYDIVAIFADGSKSPAARVTIVQGQGNEGVMTSSAAGGAQPSSSAAVSSAAVLNNAPLTPGILAITGPTPGPVHRETGTGFLLEGKTSKETASMYVNDYKLQLYRPGVTFWNYLADAKFGNLKPGSNAYAIVARNAKGEVLDRLTYTVEYQPATGNSASSLAAPR